MSRQIANRYAVAIFKQAKDDNVLKNVLEDLESIQLCLNESNDFKRLVEHPTISYEKKREIIESLFKGKAHDSTLKALYFLALKKRLNLLSHIIDSFVEHYYQTHNILKATISSNTKLTKSQLSNIEHHLKLKFASDIELSFNLEEAMLGGLRIQIDDSVYDMSLDSQLARFKSEALNTY